MSHSSDNNPGLSLGLNPLSYQGVNPYTPPDLFIKKFPPTVTDGKNMQRGALWLNVGSTGGIPKSSDIYMLVSQALGINTWVPFGGGTGTIQFLRGNSGGQVGPDGTSTINVLGGSFINIVGNPGTNTLTVNITGIGTITGGSGGAVHADGSGNVTLTPGSNITIIGNPGSHALTIAATVPPTGVQE